VNSGFDEFFERFKTTVLGGVVLPNAKKMGGSLLFPQNFHKKAVTSLRLMGLMRDGSSNSPPKKLSEIQHISAKGMIEESDLEGENLWDESSFEKADDSAEGESGSELLGEADAEIFSELSINDEQAILATVEQDPETIEDARLAREFVAGSDQAFVQLYAKYETPLLLYCRRMMFSDKLAEDAFQEIWLKVFQFRDRATVVSNFRALLFRSARNLCLNTLRLERYRSGTSEGLVKVRAKEDSSQQIEQQEIRALMTKALAKLPFEQREAFVLHEYSGYSYIEIATMMGTTEANIKVRSFRARLRLRKLIGSWLGLADDDDPTNSI